MAKELPLAIVSEKAYPSFHEVYGTNIIRLVIGREERVFQVHEKRICAKIPSFVNIIAECKREEVTQRPGLRRIVAPASKEGLSIAEALDQDSDLQADLDEDLSISFPDGDLVSWDMLISWVYHSTIPALKRDYSCFVGWNWDPFAFYVLVDKLDISYLKDTIMSTFQEGQAVSKLWLVNERLDWTWGHTTPGCGMRRYLVLALVRNIVVYKDPKEPNPKKLFTVDTKEIAAVMSKYPDLLEAVVDAMRGKDKIKARDPRVVDPCEFHEHWPSMKCTFSKNSDGMRVEDEENKNEADLDKTLREKEKNRVMRYKDASDKSSGDSS